MQEQLSGEIIAVNPEAMGFPAVLWQRRVETDKWDNQVSLIHFPDFIYRLVHHTPAAHRGADRMSLYAGRGRSLKVRTYFPSSDIKSSDCTIRVKDDQIFRVAWGDGDNLGVEVPSLVPEAIKLRLQAIHEDNWERFLAEVICIVDAYDLWITKS